MKCANRKCNNEVKGNNPNKKYCSKTCCKEAHRKKTAWEGSVLSSSMKGSISELVVAVDLMKRGWDVYRALSPAAPTDLIAIRDNQTIKIEVRSGSRDKNSSLCFPRFKDRDSFSDQYAVVEGKDIFYIPIEKKI